MKLILASQGFTTPEIAEAVTDFVGKPAGDINIAIINESYVGIAPARDMKWLISELAYIPQYFGGVISFVNLRAHPITEVADRLAFADLIYIVGGAQLVLPKLFRETGFDEVLRHLAETKVIMGTSAGANILGQTITNPEYWQNQYGKSEKFLAERNLELVDFNILPHFARADHPHRNVETLQPIIGDNPFPLYGISDTQAVIYDNGDVRVVGGECAIFGNQMPAISDD